MFAILLQFPVCAWRFSGYCGHFSACEGRTFELVACGSAKLEIRHWWCMVNRVSAALNGEQVDSVPNLLWAATKFCLAFGVQLPWGGFHKGNEQLICFLFVIFGRLSYS